MENTSPVFKPPVVKEYLTKGARFTKWDDDTAVTSPVTLKLDSKGYYLYWTHQNHDMEFLELTSIRDTRSGKYAKLPKVQKVRNVFNLDFPESHYLTKTLTIVSGPDMVNLTFHNFFASKENVSKDWADDILAIAYNPLMNNACRQTYLDKIYVRITLKTNKDGKIPVKNIYKMFPADRKRVEAALVSSHLPKGKNDTMKPEEFTETQYRTFLMNLCPRPEIYEIFATYSAKAKPYMTKENLAKFINEKQHDSRLNDMLFPPLKPDQVKSLIEKYEPAAANKQRGQISPEGLLFYLIGSENYVVAPENVILHQDMNQPLPHYYIKSSHNTYLTAGQFSGISSPEMYRQCLLAGCRCLELDCWKGKPPEEEPIITHGFTMTTEILFKDVIEAIAECAFKTSQYPVILSFENHVDCAKQQEKMAEYCRTIFGDALLTDPLEKYPLKPGHPIPSPAELMGKILIKNKKNQSPNKNAHEAAKKPPTGDSAHPHTTHPAHHASTDELNRSTDPHYGHEADHHDHHDEHDDHDDHDHDEEMMKNSDEGTAGQEVNAVEAMSSLVNYIQPNKFISFEHAKKKNRSYAVTSFVETKGGELATKSAMDFVSYNKRQMSRIYPKGTRMDSSNYNPQLFWNAGCQMVALNYQTMDFPMQLNMAMFEYNGRTGWLLKHDFLRRPDKTFDPHTADKIDAIVSNTVSVKIYSGQFLSDKNAKTGVEVEVIGLPGDPKRKYKTKWSAAHNSINPVWNEEPFVFEKILMPEMAYLRICVHEESGKFIGHRIIPIHALRSGFHHICLRSESNMPLDLPAVFAYIEVKDYIPASFADFTDLLSNPFKEDKKVVKPAPIEMPPPETSNNNTPETPSKPDTAVPDPAADSSSVPEVAPAPTPTPIPAPRATSRAAPTEATLEATPEDTPAAPPAETPVAPPAETPAETSVAPPEAPPAETPAETPTPLAPPADTPEFPPANTPAGTLLPPLKPPLKPPLGPPWEAPPAAPPEATPAETPAAPQEPSEPSPEPTTATIDELKQHKTFVKISKKHEKQIKDLETKYKKKGDDLVKKYSKIFAALQNQLKKKKAGSLKKGDIIDAPDSAPAPDPKVAEVKEKLKTELTQLRKEQYDLTKKKKEEHSAEQSMKLLEIAKQKHASELKALKESVDSETKTRKKKLEVKRNEKISEMVKSGSDKATLERIKKELNTTFIQEVVEMTTTVREQIVGQQEKLEKKQAATLDEIKEKTDKHNQEVNTEFDEKMKALPKDVEEGVNSTVRPYFPDEVEKPKENGS
ncbi:1-phosphatidylinositol 4,5-bisphosphate phosphodiesterase beta-2-like [Polyodon spathula]|uniref:1-phosphatidylinositol 4,5-bisphosphate phosphodiesterase beta-2-like n=1 Tax=Polyodon spathula TaxID=7913 RepID=UPI001B7E2D7A|nr:1-phosphatidylinositol 4,5-bisphosphate phosphodiesterase beta-2-like [Polyodon spathula]